MKNKVPKVLIVGQYFTTKASDTVTMTHLFRRWGKENIAVAAGNLEFPDFEICENYYQLGNLERKNKFPFNIISRTKFPNSGPLDKPTESLSKEDKKGKISLFKQFYHKTLILSGLVHTQSKFILSKELEKWITEFSPDYIYSQLSNLELILFVDELNEKLKIPIAIHILDDWPSTIGKKSLLKTYWNNKINKAFKSLLGKTSIFFSIGDAMSKEYYLRYGKKFIAFHNPVNLDFWGAYSKTDYKKNEPFTVLYTGRIGNGIRSCFFDIAYAIENLIQKGFKIELQLQLINKDESSTELLKEFKFIKFNDVIPYDELPAKLSKADVLLLPNDFEEKVMPFLKYSIPTKASEYMISGTPILVYADKDAAITAHAVDNKWAYVVSERNKELLIKAIAELYNNKELRINLGAIAKKFAQQEFDETIVTKRFQETFVL